MMKHWRFILLIILVVVAILEIGLYFLLLNRLPTIKPSIKIISPQVFANDQALKTGDKLDLDKEVKTTTSGEADIYFADGSIAHLEPNTSLVIKNSAFDKEKKTAISRIVIGLGEVISQVKELATPESIWEVRTANAVAVVRGTEYSVKFDRDISLIRVFDGLVLVSVIDTEGIVIEGTSVVVGAGQFTEISSDSVQLKKKPDVLEAVLIYSDDSRRDVTGEVEWKLSDEDGSLINAIWQDPVTGGELRGQTKVDDN